MDEETDDGAAALTRGPCEHPDCPGVELLNGETNGCGRDTGGDVAVLDECPFVGGGAPAAVSEPEDEPEPVLGVLEETQQAIAAGEDPEDFATTGRGLVVASPEDVVGALVVMDRHDMNLVLERLRSKVVSRTKEKLFYSFHNGTSQVTDLSVSGVMECVLELNNTGKCSLSIVDSPPVFEVELADTDFAADVQHVVCTVQAVDRKTGTAANGTASEPRKFKLTTKTAEKRRRDGKYVPDDLIVSDPFARQKALNKAERNALRKLIPEFIAQTLIAERLGDDVAVTQIQAGAGAAEIAELPPPLTTPEADVVRARIQALYDELKAVDASILPPAAYFAYRTRSNWSMDELEKFEAYIADKITTAKGGA